MRFEKFIAKLKGKKCVFAVLVDPDKYSPALIAQCEKSRVSCFLVGGSVLKRNNIQQVIRSIRKISSLPVVLFPGDEKQLTSAADGLLLLSLISGDNPEYIIGKQVRSVERIRKLKLKTLSTAYILVQGQHLSTTQKISGTSAIAHNDIRKIKNTSIAGEMLGFGAVYLEAGSGARATVPVNAIRAVKKNIHIPLIVGGGIDSALKARKVIKAGADLVVVGNALERNPELLVSIGKEFK